MYVPQFRSPILAVLASLSLAASCGVIATRWLSRRRGEGGRCYLLFMSRFCPRSDSYLVYVLLFLLVFYDGVRGLYSGSANWKRAMY
jgi:hypothetical protein